MIKNRGQGRNPGGREPGPIRVESTTLLSLFAYMDAAKIEAKAVAIDLGIEPQRLSEYRRGKVVPSLIRAEQMAELLGGRLIFIPGKPIRRTL